MPRIRLTGTYANFDGSILGVDFTDGVADAPAGVANLISAVIGPIEEIDESGNVIGTINFDPRASLILPEESDVPRTPSNYPVDTAALKAQIDALPDLSGYAAALAAIDDLTTRVEALETPA